MKPTITRRDFLCASAATGALVGMQGLPVFWTTRALTSPDASLTVLVLGGTGQTGPHLIEQLLAAGHTVTLFNRGNRSKELFPGVECLIGDLAPRERGALHVRVFDGRLHRYQHPRRR